MVTRSHGPPSKPARSCSKAGNFISSPDILKAGEKAAAPRLLMERKMEKIWKLAWDLLFQV